ncbi:MAG: PA2169 family four-helix-bundle protein [Mariniblastus sp.]
MDDKFVKSEFLAIARERDEVCKTIDGLVALAKGDPVDSGTWLGSLRTVWAAFRSGLNSGDVNVMLIEAERDEASIKSEFERVFPLIAGNPINDVLLRHYEIVKSGHDRVVAMRDAFQNA